MEIVLALSGQSVEHTRLALTIAHRTGSRMHIETSTTKFVCVSRTTTVHLAARLGISGVHRLGDVVEKVLRAHLLRELFVHVERNVFTLELGQTLQLPRV